MGIEAEEARKLHDKIIVLTSENCPSCRVLEKKIEKSEERGRYLILPVEESEDAKMLAKAFDIRSVPTLLYAKVEDGKLYICKIGDDGKAEECMEADIVGD